MPTDRTLQPGILDESPPCHWAQQYTVVTGVDVADLRTALADVRALEGSDRGPTRVTLCIGASLLGTLAPDEMPPGMRPYTDIHGTDGVTAPATQDDLLVWFSSPTEDRNLAAAWLTRSTLEGLADLREETAGFTYFEHLDLSGFEDGTENPKGEERAGVARIPDGPAAGGSFVVAMRWVHDLGAIEAMDVADQEQIFGRTKDGSVELDPLPERAHIERVVMEDDAGEEREIYRRSFPYGDTSELGLFFLAFNADLSTFVDMLERMYGVVDGQRDRLTDVSRAVSGAYYVAPPVEVLDAICPAP